jgi:hypothetical protein
VEDAFAELVGLARLLPHPNLSFEVLLTREEEVRRYEPGRAWRRRGWVVVERRLLGVVERHLFRDARELRRLLPAGLPNPFSTADLSDRLQLPRHLAQKMAYCLREAGILRAEGKRGNAIVYRAWRGALPDADMLRARAR